MSLRVLSSASPYRSFKRAMNCARWLGRSTTPPVSVRKRLAMRAFSVTAASAPARVSSWST